VSFGLLEQLQPLGHQLAVDRGQAGEVAARPGKAGNRSNLDGLTHGRKDDGDLRSRLLDGHDCGGVRRDNHIQLEPDQFGRELGEPIELAQRPSVLDGDVLAINPAMLPQPFTERLGK